MEIGAAGSGAHGSLTFLQSRKVGYMQFQIIGHAWNRRLLMNDGGCHKSFTMPAGAFLLADLLQINHCCGDEALEYGALVPGSDSVSFGNSLGFSGKAIEASIGDGEDIIVLDEGYPFATQFPVGRDILWACGRRLPNPELLNPIKQNVTLMLDVKALRQSGALISRQVSWERTATDLLWQLKNNPKFSYLLGTKYLYIVFAEEAGILLRGDPSAFSARLILYSGKTEGQTWEDNDRKDLDVRPVKVACAAAGWAAAKTEPDSFFDRFCASPILASAARLVSSGYRLAELEARDFSRWTAADAPKQPYVFCIPEPRDRQFSDPDYWCIGQRFQNTTLYDIALNYVEKGRDVIDGIPKFTCGKLTTIDRREIEAFQNIRNLMVKYAAGKSVRPLSIAVFGAPGSGKSFGVKQIAKTLLSNVEALEINVSQLTSQDDLSAAFHSVRDIVLKGKLPLVFFDEFDSSRDGVLLGWLKSFLMPMQDGEFKDENGVHPVGKCIFVFAGGTAATFDDFVRPMYDKEAERAFKNVKAPDFVSRLRGTINILGPNQVPGSDEQGFILRRALLLRSFLEGRKLVSKAGTAQVSRDILRAMLLVPKYEHGARSMEAILDMSRMEGASFEPVSLPFYTQMQLHVDADAFIRLVLKDVILNGYTDALAEAIHEDFRAKQTQRNLPIHANVDVPWAELSDSYRADNIRQATDIPRKLALIGCAFDLGDAPYPTVDSFTDEEILLLAKDEHARWMAAKLKDGWIYGPVRDESDPANRTHPLLLPFGELRGMRCRRISMRW